MATMYGVLTTWTCLLFQTSANEQLYAAALTQP
jgi:hypothetical protein